MTTVSEAAHKYIEIQQASKAAYDVSANICARLEMMERSERFLFINEIRHYLNRVLLTKEIK